MFEKEIRMLDAIEEEKYEENDGEDIEHLGATDLCSYVTYRVLTGTKKKI